MKKQTKADKAFVAKIGSITFGFGPTAGSGGGCPVCGSHKGHCHPFTVSVEKVEPAKPDAGEESFAV